MKRKRHSTISLVVLTLVTLVINHVQTKETPRGLMSAPLDLLSESLASSTSLINQLLMKRRGEISSGPQASALLAKEARRLPNDPVRQSFRRRRRKTTQAPSTEGPQATSSSNRETLVFACPEPEGCPEPVSGQKYEPVRVTRPNAQARPPPSRNVLETIFRQEVVGERKRPVMRIRKKQRKPSKSQQPEVKEAELPVEAVEMVSEMIKEAGPVITQQEIEIISDVSQEVGAKVNEKQVKVLSLLVDSMGPELESSELKTMAEVVSTIEENDNLAPDSTLKVVAEMVKAKVGDTMTPQELDQIQAVMTTGQSSGEEAKESGLTDHAAEMVAQMINNIGPEATDMEVKIVADMIKELDKDVAKETAEVMAAVLKEVMLEPVSPELVHNVSAAVSQGEASLTPEDIKMIAEVIKETPIQKKKEEEALVSPEVIQMVAEMAMEKPSMPDREVVRAVERETGEEVSMDTVEVVKVVATAMGEEKVTQLEDADLEIISVMVNEIQDDKVASPTVRTNQQQSGGNEGAGAIISEKEANFLSEVVKLFGSRVTPAERAELEVEVKKMNPSMNENEAEVMTELLVKMGPEVSPEEVKEVAELVQDPNSDIRSDNVEEISEMANEIKTELEPSDIKTIAKLVEKAGPQLTMREMQMISRMAQQKSASDMKKKPSMKDVAMIANIVAEVGPRISHSEATLISMMTKSDQVQEEGENKKGEEIAQIVASMGKVVTASEEKVVKMEVKKMIPFMKENEAEVMTKVLVAMGPEVLPEEVKEVAELVLEDSPLSSSNIDSNNVEEIIEMAKEIQTELEPTEVQAMASLIGKAGPHLTMREMQMISRMMAQKSGIKAKVKDVAMMAKIVDEVGPTPSDTEAGLISMLTTQHQNDQDIDSSLGEAVVEVISTMGNAITEPEKLVIQETIQNVTDEKITGAQAEMMAEVIQMAGTDVSAEKVEILAEVVVKATEIDTPEEMKNVTEIIEDKLAAEPLQAAEVMTVANVMGHMGMISKTMTLSEEMEVVSVSQQLGAEVTPKEVEAVNEIMEVAKAPLSMEDAKLVEVVSKVLEDKKKEIVLKKEDVEHLADMMSSPHGSLMDAPTVATMMEKMLQEKAARMEKVQVMAQILVEISPNVSPQNVTEVAKLVIEDNTSDVTMQDVKSMASVARQLNTELSFKEVKAIAGVKADSGAVMSFNEMKQAVAEANQVLDEDKAIEMKDVQAVSEMIDIIQAEGNDDKIELVAIMTMVAKVEIISPESSHRFTTTGITNDQEMSRKEVENLVEMVEKVAEMKGETQVQMEKIVVQELLQMTSLKMTKDKAETAVKIMEQLSDLDTKKAKMVVETLEESSSIDLLSVEKVEKVAELAQDLSEEVEPIDMVVVSNLVSRMGPNPSHRQVEMVARLAANSDVQVKMEDVVVINDIANELGNEISQPEAELILLMTADNDKSHADSLKVMATKEATDVADALQSMGTFMTSDEIDDLKSMIAEASPKLDSKEVGLMTEVLLKVGPDVDAELVEKVAEVTEKVSDSMSPHLVDMIADMAGDLESKLTAKEVDKVVELVQKTGSVMSPRELKMIQRMSKKDGIDLNPQDIQVINEMVKMLGPDIQEEEVELVALITEEVGNKATDASAEKLVDTLQSMQGKRVSLEELEELENQIEKMEPLMTNSKAQVMSQVLIEADPELIDSNDVEELAEIVMQTSDDITPGDVEEIAEIARGGDGEMTEKEVKVVADMTAKFGQSLSNREVHMIARMMRSSGLVVSMNDIVMVSEIVKMMGTNHITKEDSKLVAKLTEMVSDEATIDKKKSKPTKKPFTRVSSLPQMPTVSSLPSRPATPPAHRLKMRVKNKERRKGASRPPPRTYVPTTTTESPPSLAQGPMNRMPIRIKQDNDDGEFGLKRPNTLIMSDRLPTFQQKPIRENLPDFPIQSLRPTLESLTTSTESERTVEDSTKIRLEEFLMRNRPTPFRTTFPSEDPPEEGDFLDAIEPTSADSDGQVVSSGDVIVKMPGDSFMQISMGKSGFSESLKLPPPPQATGDDDQEGPTNQAQQTVSRDTLKSVAENFSFTKNEPQGMLMSFLMKTKPTMKPEMTTSSPTNMIWTEDEPMRQNLFPRRGNGESSSSSLDNSIRGNFIRMKMGDKEPQGVEPSVMPKLEKTKITLDMDGNSFMSMQMGSDVLSERMSSIDDTVYEDNYNDIPMLKRTVKRKIPSGGSSSNFAAEDPWQGEVDTPFTVRPTLPIGQATIWPHQTPEATPFTVRPSTLRPVRPTLKPFINLGKTQDVWQENTTPTPFTVRPTRRGQAFTVRPTKHPVNFNYIHKSPQGSKLKHAHDVKLKSPYETSTGFSGDTSYLKNNYHKLQNGFMGIGSLRHPGMHDDRPPYKQPLQKEEETFKASFGDVKFNLPAHGSLPDIPVKTAETDAILRDLPNVEQLDYESDDVGGGEGKQYGKSYLKNPYGADFIRLEIDSDRYKHNKTRRIGTIHHIPLKVHGYAETSEFPVSTDTERPVIGGHHHPPKMQSHRPKKQVGGGVKNGNQPSSRHPFKAVKNAMETIPHAIHHLPNLMQSLVSNHASWMDKVWPNEDGSTKKSFDAITSLQKKDIDQE